MLLLRLVGLFLLRLAERRFLGLLFHEPPRRTRLLNDACPFRNPTPRSERWSARTPSLGSVD